MAVVKNSGTAKAVGTRNGKSKRGRNPSIDMAKIEEAVRSIGETQEDLTMKEVAEYLGVNVTTLYRHIGGIDGLRRIRAELSHNDLDPVPSPKGRTWKSWLMVLSDYYRKALLDHPDLLDFAQAALDPNFEKLEEEASMLVEYGFEPRAALLAHSVLITTITGYVHQEMQTLSEAAAGYSHYYTRLFQNLDAHPERLPTLRSVNLSQRDLDRDLNFKALINYTIAGIASQPGAPKNDGLTL